MYTAYYGFHEKPFALSPDPRYLFLSDAHREVLGHLVYGIEQGEGFMAISGEVGTGKTTLCRTLLERLGGSCEIAFLFNPMLSPTELIKAINGEFDISRFGESRTELLDVLNTFLLEKHDEGRRVLVIIDEAQNLPDETLEQLRLLSNLESSTSKLLQIVLIGQPELDEKLGARPLRQLRQRISVWWSLGPMTRTETAEYVRHRLRIASGGDRPIFTRAALVRIHRYSGGVPRVINVLCDRCLLAGYGEGAGQIGASTVRRVAREIRLDRSPGWLPSPTVAGIAAGVFAAAIASAVLLRPASAPPDPAASDATRSAEPKSPVAGRAVAPLPRVAAAPPLAPARDPIDEVLPLLGTAAGNAAALQALFDAWGMADPAPAADGFAQALAALESRGMRSLSVGTLEEMRAFDLPVLLRLDAPDGGERAVLLRQLDETHADLEGLVPGQALRVRLAELETRWQLPGYAVWRDPARLPSLLEEGASGPAVGWLKQRLARLGHDPGGAVDHFDPQTTRAVAAFQRAEDLPADGRVGPLTQLRLHRAVPEQRTPLLVRRAQPAGAP